MRARNRVRPVHPGEILKEYFLKPAGLSVNALAKALHVPTPRINDIVLERRSVTADTAMRRLGSTFRRFTTCASRSARVHAKSSARSCLPSKSKPREAAAQSGMTGIDRA